MKHFEITQLILNNEGAINPVMNMFLVQTAVFNSNPYDMKVGRFTVGLFN